MVLGSASSSQGSYLLRKLADQSCKLLNATYQTAPSHRNLKPPCKTTSDLKPQKQAINSESQDMSSKLARPRISTPVTKRRNTLRNHVRTSIP